MSAIWVAAAGVAVSAIGAGVSAYGAAQSAEAIAEANKENAQREQALYERQQQALGKLTSSQMNKLSNLGNIFDRMESTGAFGSGDTLKNLRQAQADYSALAAGDFSGFENQLRQSMSDSLIATAGAGAPIGTFAGLAAQDQMNLRGQGIQTTMGISEYLSKEAYQLLGNEFGIMDKKFEVGYRLDRERTTNMSNYALGQAATEGVATTAYGNAGQQIGSSVVNLASSYATGQRIAESNATQIKIAEAYGNRSQLPQQKVNPVTGQVEYAFGPEFDAWKRSMGGYGQNTGVNNLNAINTGVNNPFPTYDTGPVNAGAGNADPTRVGNPYIMFPKGSGWQNGTGWQNPNDANMYNSTTAVPIAQENIKNYNNTFGAGVPPLSGIGASF